MSATSAIVEKPDVEIPAELWEEAGWLPCTLCVELPVRSFSVRDLLELSVGSLVETHSKVGGGRSAASEWMADGLG